MISNTSNLSALQQTIKPGQDRPLANWRDLNDAGQENRIIQATGQSVVTGAGKALAHEAVRQIARESAPTPAEHAKQVATGSIVSAAVHVAKDVLDTVTNTPNTGEYSNGGPLSNKQSDGSPKPNPDE
jgi:hypothetical protein